MIYRNCTINVKNDVSELNEDIVLYRGDREVEIYFTIVTNPYLYRAKMVENIIEKTNASYGQMIIKVPNDKPPIIGDITETNEGKVVLKITGEMIDEIEENGDYDFQIRLYDDTKVSRVTIPPVLKKLHIKEPIAIEDNNASNLVGIAKVGYARVGAGGVQRPTLNEDQTYNKKSWIDDEPITKDDLNVLEDIADKNTTNIKKLTTANNNAHIHDNKDSLDKITDEKITSWESKAEGSHNHDTVYAKKSDIPVVDVTKQYVDDELSKKSPLHEHPYLPNTTKVPTKTSELTNDSGYLTEHQDISGKVDKEDGKGLSTNDYTTVEKTKLNNIEENANNYVHPSNHSASMITQDETHRFVTDVEKNIWNNKLDENHNHDNNYATKSSEHTHANKAILDSITQDKINQWDNGGNSQDNSTIPKLSTICVKNDSGNPLLTLDFDLIPKDKSTVYLNDVFTKVQGNGILKIRRDGVEHTFGVLSTDYMLVTIGYKTSTNTLLITNTRKAMEFDFNTNKSTLNELSSLNGKASISTVLTKTNSTEYAPTKDYHPATKKYVDDKFKGISTFPLDTQTTMQAVDTGVLSDENNQLVVDWFNEINNDQNYYCCLFIGMIIDICEIGDTEIGMSKAMFDGVGLMTYHYIINKSAENKITITLKTKEFSLTPKLE